MFEAEIRDGHLLIGDQDVLAVKGVEDQPVWAAVRPEGFVLDENGPLVCNLNRVEVMGRDTSVVSSHEAFTGDSIRSIISAENLVDTSKETVAFRVKPNKLHLFRKDTEERLRYEVE